MIIRTGAASVGIYSFVATPLFAGGCVPAARRRTIGFAAIAVYPLVATWGEFIEIVLKDISLHGPGARVAVGTVLALILIVLIPAILIRSFLRSLTKAQAPASGEPEIVVCDCGRLVSSENEYCPQCGRDLKKRAD